MTNRNGGERARRARAYRTAMAWGLLVSALVHAVVLLEGRIGAPRPPGATTERPRVTESPALRIVRTVPEPAERAEPVATPDAPRALRAEPAPAGPPPTAPARGASVEPAPAGPPSAVDLPALDAADPGRLGTGPAGAPRAAIATFDLRPAVREGAGAPGAGEAEARGPGLFRRVLGGLLGGLSVAIRVPCGAGGAPGEPLPGGAPVVPDGGGMPGLPGVGGRIPTGPGAVGMPEPEVIGSPAVPEPTFGGTEGPVAGVDGRGALEGLIGCEDGSRGGPSAGGWPGAGGRGGGGLGGIFRPGGGFRRTAR